MSSGVECLATSSKVNSIGTWLILEQGVCQCAWAKASAWAKTRDQERGRPRDSGDGAPYKLPEFRVVIVRFGFQVGPPPADGARGRPWPEPPDLTPGLA